MILPAQAQPLPGRGRLDGHVVVVTGAGSRGEQFGVGRATAIAAALEGAHVVLVDRVADDARRTAEMLGRERAPQILVVETDTTSPDDTQTAADAAVERFGGIDALVNNVGIVGAPGTAEDVDLGEWQRGLEANVTSGMLMTQACLPHLVRSRLGASIVNLTSVAGSGAAIPTSSTPRPRPR